MPDLLVMGLVTVDSDRFAKPEVHQIRSMVESDGVPVWYSHLQSDVDHFLSGQLVVACPDGVPDRSILDVSWYCIHFHVNAKSAGAKQESRSVLYAVFSPHNYFLLYNPITWKADKWYLVEAPLYRAPCTEFVDVKKLRVFG
jgi:hypothetical protein